MFFLSYVTMGVVLPIMLTMYCYIKVFLRFKRMHQGTLYEKNIKATRVLWFSSIQVICFLPGLVLDIVAALNDKNYSGEIFLVTIFLRRCWGFLNLLVYWFLRSKTSKEEAEESEHYIDNMSRLSSSSSSLRNSLVDKSDL